MARFFLFGAGYCGRYFAKTRKKTDTQIFGTTRHPEAFEQLHACGIEPLLFNGTELSNAIKDALFDTTHLLISIPPLQNGKDCVGEALETLSSSSMPNLSWIGYLSSIGVYGDYSGAWIDESNETRALDHPRIAAERKWLDIGKTFHCLVSILRLSGIYGPKRNIFVRLAENRVQRIRKPNHVFNRIYVDDIASIVDYLADNLYAGVFNVTDDEPASFEDIFLFAAEKMGIPFACPVSFDDPSVSPSMRSFFNENRRVSNHKIKKKGYQFSYPDYRKGLTLLWENNSWNNEI